jgi:hypothetical protein
MKAAWAAPASKELTSPRPADIPAWDRLSSDQKGIYARMMKCWLLAPTMKSAA